ncbi:anti-sigma factor [Curtobacterium sp. MCJR17_043]|uniref:anti-sigma factor n=1 Tax=Curtobacterium sp. MCJR17_043 TaxID=2175660 RepID=UPI0024E03B4F|nr:anti-sigma factor [Curtobacterium sp. MCJR17_043]WIB37108.1 anti-sigma factor [Curtobacterium sp. MCJR17_043]
MSQLPTRRASSSPSRRPGPRPSPTSLPTPVAPRRRPAPAGSSVPRPPSAPPPPWPSSSSVSASASARRSSRTTAAPPATTQAASGLDQIYAAPDFQRSSAKVKGGGTATVVWSGQLGRSAVILDGVKAAPKGKTYELWYIGSQESGGTIEAAGLMHDVDGGVRSAVLRGTMVAGDTIGITVEPAGGSDQPTSEPVVAVPTSEA